MKRALWVLGLACWFGGASAHDTQSAGQVQVTFLTSADDGLDTQAPTTLRFVLEKAGQPLSSCRCRLLLYQGTPSARVAPLLDVRLDALQAGRVGVQVPPMPVGNYTVVLDGRPVTFGDFDAFRLRFSVATP